MANQIFAASKAEPHATPISSPARKRLRFEGGGDEEQTAESGRNCIELRGAFGGPCHDKHNSIMMHIHIYTHIDASCSGVFSCIFNNVYSYIFDYFCDVFSCIFMIFNDLS